MVSDNVLKSSMHRVVAPPGEQGRYARSSIVYFSRPGNNIPLNRVPSKLVPQDQDTTEQPTAAAWIANRAKVGHVLCLLYRGASLC
jgi:isopenicillin N synthase-like dioxygenase